MAAEGLRGSKDILTPSCSCSFGGKLVGNLCLLRAQVEVPTAGVEMAMDTGLKLGPPGVRLLVAIMQLPKRTAQKQRARADHVRWFSSKPCVAFQRWCPPGTETRG